MFDPNRAVEIATGVIKAIPHIPGQLKAQHDKDNEAKRRRTEKAETLKPTIKDARLKEENKHDNLSSRLEKRIHNMYAAAVTQLTEAEHNMDRTTSPVGREGDGFKVIYEPRDNMPARKKTVFQNAVLYIQEDGGARKVITTTTDVQYNRLTQEEIGDTILRNLTVHDEGHGRYEVNLVEQGALDINVVRREYKLVPMYTGDNKPPTKYMMVATSFQPAIQDDGLQFVAKEVDVAFVDKSVLENLAKKGLDTGRGKVDLETHNKVQDEINKAKRWAAYSWDDHSKEFRYVQGTGKLTNQNDEVTFGDYFIPRDLDARGSSSEEFEIKVYGKKGLLGKRPTLLGTKICPKRRVIQYLPEMKPEKIG
jgi:hypothetical protein